MDHKEILLNAAKAVTERSVGYGTPAEGVTRAASIASLILGDTYTAYEIAVILHAVKLSRISASPQYLDSYVDGINFLAFAAEFVGAADGKASSTPGLREDMEDLARLVPRGVARKQADFVRARADALTELDIPLYGERVVAEALAHKHEEDGA
jgi:hypothetical protein